MSGLGLFFVVAWTLFAASTPWAMAKDYFKPWWVAFCVLMAASIIAIFESRP